MSNECKLVREHKRTREFLQKFAAKAAHLDIARKNTPYHRESAGNKYQTEYIDQLREKYAGMKADSKREILIQKFKLPSVFVFDTTNDLRIVELVKGLYRPDGFNHVDFANKNIGGGFLTYGMAQEEVMCCERTDFGFFIAEMYAKRTPLIIEDDEALVIHGADICAAVDFYGRVPEDWDKKCCYFREPKEMDTGVVAIDCIRPKWKKYERQHVEWCIKKAYCGFQGVKGGNVTTGQWGCGAFFNNKNAMFCIQTMAAWMAGKKLFYHAGYRHVSKGMEMAKRWGKEKVPFPDALNELLKACAEDPDFETSWDPSLATDEFAEVQLAGNIVEEEEKEKTEEEKVADESRVKVIEIKDFLEYAQKKWPDYGQTGGGGGGGGGKSKGKGKGKGKGGRGDQKITMEDAD